MFKLDFEVQTNHLAQYLTFYFEWFIHYCDVMGWVC